MPPGSARRTERFVTGRVADAAGVSRRNAIHRGGAESGALACDSALVPRSRRSGDARWPRGRRCRVLRRSHQNGRPSSSYPPPKNSRKTPILNLSVAPFLSQTMIQPSEVRSVSNTNTPVLFLLLSFSTSTNWRDKRLGCRLLLPASERNKKRSPPLQPARRARQPPGAKTSAFLPCFAGFVHWLFPDRSLRADVDKPRLSSALENHASDSPARGARKSHSKDETLEEGASAP